MRIALHSVIADGAVHDCRTHHARVPDGLTALFSRAGIRDGVIWRSGDRLFHLVECDDWDDWDAATAVVGPDPANARWQADIGRFVAGVRDADGEGGFAPLENVWSLAEQRAAAAG